MKVHLHARSRAARLGLAGGAAAFAVVAILNCGGYRFGVGDQAFYVPAVVQHLDPDLFPRSRPLLHVQDRFMLYDDALAAVVRWTGIPLPWLFLVLYLAGLAALFAAIAAIGSALYSSWWTVAALAALATLRHRITQTGANSLEAYFQPRMLAFGLGACAIAAFLRGRAGAALALVGVAFSLHPTTAIWFGIWLGAALLVAERAWRMPLAIAAAAALGASAWAVTLGPMQGHLSRMDSVWASALTGKDYIFPSDWGAAFWLVNGAYLVIAALALRERQRLGVAREREAGLVAGAAALVAVFLVAWPLMRAGVALALQLQVSRVFWMLDFLAAVYLAWLIAERAASERVRRAMVLLLVAVAAGRGVVVWGIERGAPPLAQINLPDDEWTDVMRWVRGTPPDSHVLADPGHAWKYGTSVRVAGERDVYVEEVKDLALALYSREVASETIARIRDAQGLDAMTPDELRALAERYDLDLFVTDRDVSLPLLYRNGRFRVYSLTPHAAPAAGPSKQ